MWRNPEQPRVEATPGFLLLLGALFWLDEGVGLLPWGLLACIVHELGHIAAALVCGGRVERLSLTMVGAELSFSYRTPLSYGRDSLVALAGPGANLLLGGLFFWQGRHLPAVLTLGLGVFNLLPILPLDGGAGGVRPVGGAAGPGLGGPPADRVGGVPGGIAGGGGGHRRHSLRQRDPTAHRPVAAGRGDPPQRAGEGTGFSVANVKNFPGTPLQILS